MHFIGIGHWGGLLAPRDGARHDISIPVDHKIEWRRRNSDADAANTGFRPAPRPGMNQCALTVVTVTRAALPPADFSVRIFGELGLPSAAATAPWLSRTST